MDPAGGSTRALEVKKAGRLPWIQVCHGNSDRLPLGPGVTGKLHKTMAVV